MSRSPTDSLRLAIVADLQATIQDVQAGIGVLPAIYASPAWWDGSVNSQAFTGDPLWVACWMSDSSCPYSPAGNWGGFGWQAWQTSDNSSVPGISGAVDGDQGNPGPPLVTSATTTAIRGPVNAPSKQPVTFTASVSPPPASGSVTFTASGTAISGCSNLALNGGGATCRTSALPSGNDAVGALYSTGSGYFSSGAVYDVAIQATPWPATTGTPAVATAANQRLVFWRGSDSHLWEAWDDLGPWSGPVDWTTQFGGTGLLASAPAIVVTPGGQQLVFWQGISNDLWEAWYTPGVGWSGPVDYSAQLHSPGNVLSAPSVALTPGGQQLVFWQGTGNDLFEAWFTPRVGWSGPVD